MSIKSAVKKMKSAYFACRKNDETLGDFLQYRIPEYLRRRFCTSRVCCNANGRKTKLFHHIFIHSLVLDESKAFRPQHDEAHDFESWFVTKKEFTLLLNSLYSRGYVLVKMADLLTGRVRLNKNQTPLVMSFDDMNYYEYMAGYGFPDKLDLTKEEESVTVLEQFIKEHPDFSHNGARGIIALTGYEGALGYRDLDNPDLKKLVQTLKELGYQFACHSWGHHHRIYTNTNPHGKKGIVDMEKWFAGVGKVVGKTDIFITPFGVDIRRNPLLHSYLKRKGFRYFCSVGHSHSAQKCGRCYYMERFNIDGLTMLAQDYDYRVYYGDPKEIYSEKRTLPYKALRKDAPSLVKHAVFCLKIPTVYFWDGMGEVLKKPLLLDKHRMYPDHYPLPKMIQYLRRMDGETRGFDCCGLIKSFLMGGLYHFRYDASMDLNSSGLLEKAPQKGDIASLPELPGVCLHMPGHVGIYIGNGQVIESTSNPQFGNGVVKTRLSDRHWEKWFYCPGIAYEEGNHA